MCIRDRGYTQDQVITDVLDAYDAHIAYLNLSGDGSLATGDVTANVPEEWIDSDRIDPSTTSEEEHS